MNFSYFTVFLKKRNISSKIKRSKVTDYAALRHLAESSITTTEINLYFITSTLLRIQEIRQSEIFFSEMFMLVYVCAHIFIGLIPVYPSCNEFPT